MSTALTGITYADLVKAGAPELPHGWKYEVYTYYDRPKVAVCKPGRRGKLTRVATSHILTGYRETALESTAEACRRAIEQIEFFMAVSTGTYGPCDDCACHGGGA